MEFLFGLFSIVGVLLLIPTMLVVSYIIRGFVLSHLWTWFIVPLFHVASLDIIHAIGLSMVVGYLTQSVSFAKQDDSTSAIARLVIILSGPFVTLLFGWIVHTFFM